MHRQNSLPALINNSSDRNRIFKMAKRLKQDNVDVVGEECVRSDDGKLTLTADDEAESLAISLSKAFECRISMECCEHE